MKLETLVARFHGRCVYCGKRVDTDAHQPHPDAPNRDHFIPLSRGGTRGAGNILLACSACNQAKDDMDPRLILWVGLWLDAGGFHHAAQRIASCLPQPGTAPASRARAMSLRRPGPSQTVPTFRQSRSNAPARPVPRAAFPGNGANPRSAPMSSSAAPPMAHQFSIQPPAHTMTAYPRMEPICSPASPFLARVYELSLVGTEARRSTPGTPHHDPPISVC